nr:LysR family transcriptional regulator substrate-binding protein [Planomicrobium sp. YIM 101495]
MKKGKLSIGSITSTGAHLLPKAISEFRSFFPGIELKLVEGASPELQDMVASGEVEIAILSTPLKNSQLETEVVRIEEILLAVPPDHWLTMYSEVDLALCNNEPFIGIKPINNFRYHTDDLCEKAGFQPNIVFESININTCQSLVLAGIGITFVPKMFVNEIELHEKPVYLPLVINGQTPKRAIVTAFKNIGYLSKAARAFIDILKIE